MHGSKKISLKVLALFGSPRKNGISSALHEAFLKSLEGASAIKRLHAYDMSINPCTACNHCSIKRECIFSDDMNAVYDEIEAADLVSISSPVYFSSLSGQLKIIIDRCQLIWEANKQEPSEYGKKLGFFISAGGSNYKNMFLPSVTTIRHFFNSTGITYREKDFLLVPDTEKFSGKTIPGHLLDKSEKTGKEYLNRINK